MLVHVNRSQKVMLMFLKLNDLMFVQQNYSKYNRPLLLILRLYIHWYTFYDIWFDSHRA